MSRIYEALRRADLEREAQAEQPLKLVTPPEEANPTDSAPALMDLITEDCEANLDALPGCDSRLAGAG
jgi:hypothetical protein